ncbi:MAG: zf-HC2 domain-containing protein [Armatimonadetes bacterium]|nr:zf-HC2 domain-containing protein [Armatimonadota bacterium]
MSAHHRVHQQLSAYLDGELTPAELAEVRDHLAACPECASELEGLRAIKHLLRRLAAPVLPADFVPGLRARIEPPAPRRWVWWPRPAAALAVAALVLILIAVPMVRGHLDRLKAATVGPDLFVRSYVPAASADPFADRAFLALIHSDAGVRLMGEDPRRNRR